MSPMLRVLRYAIMRARRDMRAMSRSANIKDDDGTPRYYFPPIAKMRLKMMLIHAYHVC